MEKWRQSAKLDHQTDFLFACIHYTSEFIHSDPTEDERIIHKVLKKAEGVIGMFDGGREKNT